MIIVFTSTFLNQYRNSLTPGEQIQTPNVRSKEAHHVASAGCQIWNRSGNSNPMRMEELWVDVRTAMAWSLTHPVVATTSTGRRRSRVTGTRTGKDREVEVRQVGGEGTMTTDMIVHGLEKEMIMIMIGTGSGTGEGMIEIEIVIESEIGIGTTGVTES
jgi:hypothetical protein